MSWSVPLGGGHYDRLPDLAADLIRPGCGHRGHQHAGSACGKKATATILLSSTGGDPVEIGLVTNIARPSGTQRDWCNANHDGARSKRLELLHQLIPKRRCSPSLSIPATVLSPRCKSRDTRWDASG